MDYGRQGLILQAPSKVLNVSPPSTHQQMDQNTPGMRYSNLSHIGVAYSLGANDAGASHQEISAIIGRSRPAISKITKKYEIKPFSRVTPPTENPKKLDRKQQKTLLRAVRPNRRATLTAITNILSDKPSAGTVRRRLKEVGIDSHIDASKPYLAAAHMQND